MAPDDTTGSFEDERELACAFDVIADEDWRSLQLHWSDDGSGWTYDD